MILSNDEMPISNGRWSDNLRWEYYSSVNMAPEKLITAVCCIAVYQQKIILVKNRRGWELPGGKIKDNETPCDAVVREVREETGFTVTSPKSVGFKKVIAKMPVVNPEKPGNYYPFPCSYVLFFLSPAIKTENKKTCDEITEI